MKRQTEIEIRPDTMENAQAYAMPLYDTDATIIINGVPAIRVKLDGSWYPIQDPNNIFGVSLDCPHGHKITDSCPGCDRDREDDPGYLAEREDRTHAAFRLREIERELPGLLGRLNRIHRTGKREG